MWLYVAAAAVALVYFVYITFVKPLGYWKQRKIPHTKPWIVFGNMADAAFRKKSFMDIIKDLYNAFPDKRYNGILSFTKPQLLIRDPDLIKQILIKDFNYFINRTAQVINSTDRLFSKNLTMLQGQKWRHMRNTLSPTFTSSKMRFMFTLLSDCAEEFTKYFEKQNSPVIDVEMKDIFSRFTNDAIATAAFGVKVDSLNEKKNEFFLIGQDVTNFGGLRALKFLAFAIFPALMRFLKISIFPRSLSVFLTRIVKETIDVREKNGIVRPDMIHLLLETRRGKLLNDGEQNEVSDAGFAVIKESASSKEESNEKTQLTDEDITAQALIFFFAGFEPPSTLMSFLSHELAVQPEIQERLREEIDSTLKSCDGKLTYEALMGMKYMDMVVSESLRKWPPGLALERISDQAYTIAPLLPHEEPFTLEKGVSVFVSVVGLHYDPKYFPNPEKFDPERFSDENKSAIVQCSYLPFGLGPRSCIASRFALMEIKILFFYLLSKFELVPIEKTPIPLVLSKKKLALAPDGGFWLGIQHRKAE